MFEDVVRRWGGYPVEPMDVYRDMFRLGEGYLQKHGEPAGEFKANPVAYWKNEDKEKGHFRIMFEDTFEEVLNELQEADFAILNGITYFGRKNVQEHASKMFAMIFDLDGVTDATLGNFFSGAINGGAYPVPNYVVFSGHGVHLYYLFDEPISLYPYIKLQMKELKYALTEKMWNMYTSTEEKKQHQGINQGFRVIGSHTKGDAPEKIVRAFRVNEHPFTVQQLCEYVPAEHHVDQLQLWKESKYTLEEAKKKFPDWYDKVVVKKDRQPDRWRIEEKVNGDNPYALYDWWIRKIWSGASVGHRYFAIMCLAIYAAKCNVPYERLEEDAYALIPFLNDLSEEKPFTEADVEVALECYDLRYCTFPVRDMEKISGIKIGRNKRNGRKRAAHVKVMNTMRNLKIQLGEPVEIGRPAGSGTAQRKVLAWRELYPDGKKADCIRETGLSKPTVYKWWDSQPKPDLAALIKVELKAEIVKPDGTRIPVPFASKNQK